MELINYILFRGVNPSHIKEVITGLNHFFFILCGEHLYLNSYFVKFMLVVSNVITDIIFSLMFVGLAMIIFAKNKNLNTR